MLADVAAMPGEASRSFGSADGASARCLRGCRVTRNPELGAPSKTPEVSRGSGPLREKPAGGICFCANILRPLDSVIGCGGLERYAKRAHEGPFLHEKVSVFNV